jgi:hypothetical protein
MVMEGKKIPQRGNMLIEKTLPTICPELQGSEMIIASCPP